MRLGSLGRVALTIAVVSCGGRERKVEGLPPIDVARAAASHEVFSSVATMPAHELAARVGGCELEEKLSLRVRSKGKEIEALDDQAHVWATRGGDFTASQENSRDLGRSVTYVGGRLYVQMRYGPPVDRRPEHGEATRLLDEGAGHLPATLRLLEAFVEVSDGGAVEVAGRAARRVRLGRASKAREVTSLGVHQVWRQRLAVDALEGEVLLDAASGAPLGARIAASYRWPLGDGEASATLALERRAIVAGRDPAIARPSEAVETPRRTRLEPERRALLRGLEGSR